MPLATLNQTQNQQPNTPAVNAASQATTAASPAMVPFARAAKHHVEQGQTQVLASASWASGQVQQFQVPTFGYMKSLFFTMTGASGSNSTNTVAASADAPWNLFSNVLFTDVNGTPIINLDGYALYVAMTYGGYRIFQYNQSAFGYTPIVTGNGTGGTGNFKFKLEVPAEFATDGLGCLPNMDASAQYRVNLTYNGPSTFYNTSSAQPSTSVPNISTLLELNARTRPPAVDMYGNPQATQPPSAGTVQYWTSQIFNLSSGQNTLQLTRVGNLIRNHILIFRDSNGSRANADSTGVTPSTIEFDWDAGIRYKINTDTQRQLNYLLYGFDVPAGVISFPNMSDPEGLQGFEYGQQWMSTVGSTLLKLQFTNSAAGTLQVLTNDIVPASPQVYSAPRLSVG